MVAPDLWRVMMILFYVKVIFSRFLMKSAFFSNISAIFVYPNSHVILPTDVLFHQNLGGHFGC